MLVQYIRADATSQHILVPYTSGGFAVQIGGRANLSSVDSGTSQSSRIFIDLCSVRVSWKRMLGNVQ